jgi:tRNA (mo5U34)-methyltransferase
MSLATDEVVANLATLLDGVHWHQRWQVSPGVYTPGRNPVAQLCERIRLPADLRGQRVLDVGAWNGCFSFECERRGAGEVVALSLEDPDETGFNRLKAALSSRVEYVRQSIYTVDAATLGSFDLVLFLGVLYHLRYPLLAIDKIRQMCRGKVLVESHVIDNHMALPTPHGAKIVRLSDVNRQLPGIPLWRFYPGQELNKDKSNWFGPNIAAVESAFDSAGFECRLIDMWHDRASFDAVPRGLLDAALQGTYESWGDNPGFIGL